MDKRFKGKSPRPLNDFDKIGEQASTPGSSFVLMPVGKRQLLPIKLNSNPDAEEEVVDNPIVLSVGKKKKKGGRGKQNTDMADYNLDLEPVGHGTSSMISDEEME